jgi:hypothetical protein
MSLFENVCPAAHAALHRPPQSVRIKSKASHSEVCPEAEVECVGCSGRMPRRAMKTHLAEVDYHLTELKDKWDALQGDLKAELSKPCKVCVW